MGKVHFDGLTKDARTWDQVADDLGEVRASVESIDIYRGAFSFAAMDVWDSYDQIRQQVIALLQAGATEASGAGAALRGIRDMLEENEQAAVDEFGGMWTPADI